MDVKPLQLRSFRSAPELRKWMSANSISLHHDTDSQGIDDAIARLARRTTPGALLGAETLGLAAIVGILALAPDHSILVLPFVAMTSFGLWGTADMARRKSGTRRARSAFSVFQLVVATVGAASLFVLIFAIGGVLMGTVIS